MRSVKESANGAANFYARCLNRLLLESPAGVLVAGVEQFVEKKTSASFRCDETGVNLVC